jgi:N-acetylglucosaminyldiphosphoundecaprenol N-acetyl-beta-D-mannosaminyltransferase
MIEDINIVESANPKSEEIKFLEDVTFNKTHFFGVRFDNITRTTALKVIRDFLMNKQKPRKVFFTNVHTIFVAAKDTSFWQSINNADLVLPDGSGLSFAGKFFSRPVKQNLNGTDFTPLVLETAVQLGSTVYLLGAAQNIVTECVYKLKEKYPALKITGHHSGYFSQEEEDDLINEIKIISPDILLIAMGSPAQEFFADKISEHLNSTVCLAVGGLFDFIAGAKKRAPLLIRQTGLEWFYRFLQDPKTKWERIVKEIPLFLLSVITSKLFTNNIYSSFDRRPCI